MSQQVASLYATIGAKTEGFDAGAKSVKGGLAQLSGGFKDLTGLSISTASALSLAGAAAAATAKYLMDAEKAAAESAQVDAKLEAVLIATGQAAGMTSDALDQLATNISKQTGLDDELVKSAEAVMLTFTNIGQNAFPEAIQAAADMSAVLGHDLQGSVIQLGKAMNDFTGYTALKRAGVSFSEEQINQIENFKKTNDLAGYQKLILAELQREFGGAAKAINDAGDGSANLNVAMGNLSEAIGARLVPSTRAAKTALTEFVEQATNVIEKQNELENQLNAVGVEIGYHNNLYKDGKAVTAAYALELVNNAQVAENATNNYTAMAYALGNVTGAAQDASETIATLDYDSILNVTESLAKETQSYSDRQADLTQKMQENRAEAEALYPWQTEKLTELNDKYAEMQQTYNDNAAAHTEANNQILYNLLEQKLAVDGITEAEYNQLVAAGEMFGLYDENAAKTALAMNSVSEAVANGTLQVKDMQKALDLLANGQHSIDVVLNILGANYGSQQGNTPTNAQEAQQWAMNNPTPHATGGSWMVGAGWGNEGYPMGGGHTASPGETITVTPAGQSTQNQTDWYMVANIITSALGQELDRRGAWA